MAQVIKLKYFKRMAAIVKRTESPDKLLKFLAPEPISNIYKERLPMKLVRVRKISQAQIDKLMALGYTVMVV